MLPGSGDFFFLMKPWPGPAQYLSASRSFFVPEVQIYWDKNTSHPPTKNGRSPPWKMEPQTGGGPAREEFFKHYARHGPALYFQRHRHSGHRGEAPHPLTPCLPPFHLLKRTKNENRASPVVRGGTRLLRCPLSRFKFQRGGCFCFLYFIFCLAGPLTKP